MSFRPMCAAAPRPVSQSPPPQSQAALTNAGSCCSKRLTFSRSPCAFATKSRTSSAGRAGFASIKDSFVLQRGEQVDQRAIRVGDDGVALPPEGIPGRLVAAVAALHDAFVQRVDLG